MNYENYILNLEIQKESCQKSSKAKCDDCDYFGECHLLKSIKHFQNQISITR